VPQTISTMPSDTIHAFQDRGVVALTLESHLQDARYLFNQLYAADIDYDDIVATLEREGIEKFRASFTQLLEEIAQKRHQLGVPA
jgi:transaldolase